jgi:protein ImuB
VLPNRGTGASRVAEKPGNFFAHENSTPSNRNSTSNENGAKHSINSNHHPNGYSYNINQHNDSNANHNALYQTARVNAHDTQHTHVALSRALANATPNTLLTAQHWDTFPRALATGENIRVVSAAAGKRGVRAGMSVPEARVYCAELDVREWDDSAITDAVMAMTGLLLQGSPQVTSANGAPGTWWVGATGFEHVGGEGALAEQLLHIARGWHPAARVAIADSCVAARAATWAPGQTALSVVPVGACASYLAPAPLGLIPMTEELRDALQSLGLRTVGALAALEAGDVERRWGADGIGAWRLAHGDDPRRPGLVRTEVVRSASAELASATDSMAPLLFLIRSALNGLVQQLLHDGRAAASVAITLSLDARPQHTITREIRPARPLARVAPLFDQCRALLEKWTLDAPVFAVTVSIPATAPLTADQGDLLLPSWRDAAATVDAVFVRLRAALEDEGAQDVVVHPVAGDAHRPETAGQWQRADALRLAELGVANDLKPHAQPSINLESAALRLLEKPESVVVNVASGAPASVNWRGRTLYFTAAHGPERLSGDWWRANAFARDYWRCTISGEGDLYLYHDAAGWFVQGWYD